MAKAKTIYACSNCGAQFPKWSGRCLECGRWGTLQEQVITEAGDKTTAGQSRPAAEPISLAAIKEEQLKKQKTLAEIDRVLGGGLAAGSLVLLSGEPGVGKSTLAAQIASLISANWPTLYVSGEETAGQVKARFSRLGKNWPEIKFINENNLENIRLAISQTKPKLVVVDSIQTVFSLEAAGEMGSVSQIRASAAKLLELAKSQEIAIIIIGHITKDGAIAGPKTLEHMVDTVLYLELDKTSHYHLLRATKNRFGPTNEVGVLKMADQGFKEIVKAATIFLSETGNNLAGAVISCVLDGSRPFLVEIQALVTKTIFGYPQRKASGYDLNRLSILTAVLSKRAKIQLASQDVIVNVVGGLKIFDPALDLAICLAIASSLLNLPIQKDLIVLGEVGLGGEVRPIKQLSNRLKAAAELGIKRALLPPASQADKKIKPIFIKNISELISWLKDENTA